MSHLEALSDTDKGYVMGFDEVQEVIDISDIAGEPVQSVDEHATQSTFLLLIQEISSL
jgi:hypothetical protein